jgi:hypothetical protein
MIYITLHDSAVDLAAASGVAPLARPATEDAVNTRTTPSNDPAYSLRKQGVGGGRKQGGGTLVQCAEHGQGLHFLAWHCEPRDVAIRRVHATAPFGLRGTKRHYLAQSRNCFAVAKPAG